MTDAADAMFVARVDALAVVDESDKCVGSVTRIDVLRAGRLLPAASREPSVAPRTEGSSKSSAQNARDAPSSPPTGRTLLGMELVQGH